MPFWLECEAGLTDARRPAVLVVTVEVAEEDVDELNRWYEEEHRPEKLSLPGYAGLRRFQRVRWCPEIPRHL